MTEEHVRALAETRELAALVDAVVAAAERRLAVPRFRWATVLTWNADTDQTGVRVDGDPDATQVVNATGDALVANQRVLVVFVPPHGALIIGQKAGA